VQKEAGSDALRDLGERPPRGPHWDNYKIVVVDAAELVALELGLDPIREKRGKCSMEAAESRMRRQAADGDGVVWCGVVVEDEVTPQSRGSDCMREIRREALASLNEKDDDSYRADASKAKLDLIITGGASKKGCMANNVLKKYTYVRPP